MTAAIVAYILLVAGGTALIARWKGRALGWWFVGGLVGGLPILLLASLAPRAGSPWRSRAPLVLAVFAAILLGTTLMIVAISEANLTF